MERGLLYRRSQYQPRQHSQAVLKSERIVSMTYSSSSSSTYLVRTAVVVVLLYQTKKCGEFARNGSGFPGTAVLA